MSLTYTYDSNDVTRQLSNLGFFSALSKFVNIPCPFQTFLYLHNSFIIYCNPRSALEAFKLLLARNTLVVECFVPVKSLLFSVGFHPSSAFLLTRKLTRLPSMLLSRYDNYFPRRRSPPEPHSLDGLYSSHPACWQKCLDTDSSGAKLCTIKPIFPLTEVVSLSSRGGTGTLYLRSTTFISYVACVTLFVYTPSAFFLLLSLVLKRPVASTV